MQPASTPGRSSARTAVAISSTAPTSWPLTKKRDVGCLADRLDDRSDDFAHGKRRVGVFRDRGAERRHVILRRRKDGVGNRDVGVLVDPAASLDRAVVLEFELGPDEAVGELARFDIERLNVAGDLLLAAWKVTSSTPWPEPSGAQRMITHRWGAQVKGRGQGLLR